MDYVERLGKIPRLHVGEDLALARCWRADNDEKARNRLVGSHLRLVLSAARRAAKKYDFQWDYEKLLSLVGAGNDGLFHAAFLFDPNLGHRFATHAWPWINKEIWRQARFDRSVVDRPDNIRSFRDPIKLGLVVNNRDDPKSAAKQIDYTDFAFPRARSITNEDDRCDAPTSVVVAMSNAFAKYAAPDEATAEAAHAAGEKDTQLSGRLDNLDALLAAKADQILDPREREIYRARYLFPKRKTRLGELAQRCGLTAARISQIARGADTKMMAAIAGVPLAEGCQGSVRFPTWRTIDDWCDHPKEQRKKSIAEWCGGGDYHIERVTAALEAGISANEIGKRLDIPTTTAEDRNYNPAAHLVKLAEWRRIAAEQDREQRERQERYVAHKALEQRVTLTTKGYREARLFGRAREAEDGTQTSTGEHTSPAKRAGSAA